MKLSTTLLFILFYATAFGQPYSIVQEIPLHRVTGPQKEYDPIIFKIYHDTIYVLRKVMEGKNASLKIATCKFESGEPIDSQIIPGIPPDIRILDFTINNGKLLVTSYNKLLMFSMRGSSDSIFLYPDKLACKNDSVHFWFSENINDSLVLLFEAYNYHPNDGKSGLYMSIFNTNSKKFTKNVFRKFPGVILTNNMGNWLCIVKNRIYITTPLTGDLSIFDTELNLVATSSLNLYTGEELNENRRHQTYLDSLVDSDKDRYDQIIAKYPGEPFSNHLAEFKNSIYDNGNFFKIIRATDSTHTYIQNIYAVDDSLILISQSIPDHNGARARRVVVYDPNRHAIVKKYADFPCSAPDTITKPEQYYTIDLQWGKKNPPYFHKNFIYYPSPFPLSAFAPGPLDEVTDRFSNHTHKNGTFWHLIKYELK